MLSFSDYQNEISKAIKSCDNEKLNLFCHDVVSRILPFVDRADNSELYESEIEILKILRQEAQKDTIDPALVGKYLDNLSKIVEEDEAHGLDMNGCIVEFLCALDNWKCFNETGSKAAVAAVSENLMNILDFNFVEDVSLKSWLTVPEINTEFNKQILYLRNNL